MVIHDVINFVHCFKAYSISSSTDGSNDVFIHCLPGGVALSAVEAIASETVHLNSRNCDGDDPFDSEAEFEADLRGTG